MNRKNLAEKIIQAGAIAVLRFKGEMPTESVADALICGGIRVLEVTLTTPDALSAIETLNRCFGTEVLIGAGSVTAGEQVQDAVQAGASFIVSPITKKAVIEAGHAHDVPVVPGAFTPTEAQTAHEYGADMVKIFPAGQLGTEYLKALLAPLPHLKLVPTRGVTPENAGEWIRAGAVAVGLGTALIDMEAIRQGDFSVLTRGASVLCTSIAEARKETEPIPVC